MNQMKSGVWNFVVGCGLGVFVLLGGGCGKGTPQPEAGVSAPVEGVREASDPVKPDPIPVVHQVPDELKSLTEMITKGKQGEALALLNGYVEKHPEDPRGYSLRGGVHAQLRQTKEAIADLNRFVELSPNDADAFHSRGLFYLLRGGREAACKDLEQALKINPKHSQAANHLGMLKMGGGEFLAAIKDFDLAIECSPDRSDFYNNRGMAQWRVGNLDQARSDFDRAIKINARDVNALSNRGQLSFQEKKFEEAIADFTNASVHDPYNISHFRYRHAAYLKLGLLREAEENGRHIVWLRDLFKLQGEIRKYPEDAKLQVQLGEHFLEENDEGMASKIFELVLKVHPQLPRALLGRAEVRMKRGEYQQVVDDCSQVLKAEESYEARSLRGDAYFKLQKLDEAIADYEASRRFDRQVADAYYQRSQQRASAGDQTGSESDLTKAGQMDPRLQTTASSDE